MKKLFVILLALFAFISFGISHATAAGLPTAVNGKPLPTLNPMLKKVMPAIVNIYVQGETPGRPPVYTGPNQPPNNSKFEDIGSGVIVDPNQGFIVTNSHVVRDADVVIVTLSDGRRFKGEVIGADSASDIAVVKINATHLTSVPFGNSDKVQVGDFVVAIGSPFGLLTQSVTSGVVSAMNRSDLGIENYENFIQTDAPINPGNSGGALVNLEGQVIGINTAIIAPSGGNVGIGFAIPSNMVMNVMDQLIKYGKVTHGLLGVMIQNLTPDLADALNASGVKGALITQVNPGTPGAKAGLQAKDIVEAVNGNPIDNAAQLRNAVGLTRIGSEITLKVLRNNKNLNLTVKLSQPQPPTGSASLLAGLRLRDYDEIDFDAREIKGVQILDLDDNSPAALKGMQPEDVIVSANSQPVTTVTQLIAAANKSPKRLLLEVKHVGAGTTFVVLDNN